MRSAQLLGLLFFGFGLVAFGCDAAAARSRNKPSSGFALSRHLNSAVEIDAESTALDAQGRATAARRHTANSFTPGSPYIAGSRRANVGGNLHAAREEEIEAAVPVWLPGQSEALHQTIDASLIETDERLALRRLDVAGLVREAWWRAQRAAREAEIAQSRLATARDIGSDMTRREALGESGHQDTLLAQNETLAAESEVAQADAANRAARAAYSVLTNGLTPDGALEPAGRGGPIEDHPALRAPLAALKRAEAQIRLVDASFIDNPEVGVFGRHETNQEYQFGKPPEELFKTDSTTLGFRFKVPLPTPGRNEPRRAEAEADYVKAQAEYERALRLVNAEVAAARAALAAAKRNVAVASKRFAVASEQYELARKSFRLGEANAVDLYRVRQSYLDAQRAQAMAQVELGAAESRLNQARGYAPE